MAALRMEPSEIIEMIGLSGLRGRGGAGFPAGVTHRRWTAVGQNHQCGAVGVADTVGTADMLDAPVCYSAASLRAESAASSNPAVAGLRGPR